MKLNFGDKIGIIAPSGVISDKEMFFSQVEILKEKGFKVKVFDNVLGENRHLSNTDEKRLEDLHNAFLDDSIKAIICARGGFGALRLVDKIDYSIIKENKKIFIGSSDITILLAQFYLKAGLIGHFSPMISQGFAKNVETYLDLINHQKEILPQKNHKVFVEGSAQGTLFGGNLATLVSLFGYKDFKLNEDIILFLEDINEPLYKIDKMLTQIYLNEEFRQNIKGIVFGEFTQLNKNDEKNLEGLLKEFALKFNVPASFGYDITHAKNATIVPYGQKANLLGDKICLL